jgi:hypothetical protein
VDFAGPCMGRMFLLMVDAHSKWPEVIPMKTTTAERTVDALRVVFGRNGIPEQIVSDNGPQFSSREFAHFMAMNGIRHTTSAPWHPRTNGLVERFVQTFKQAMKSAQRDEGFFQKKLSKFLLAYRNTPHATTQEIIAMLFMGRSLRTRLDLIKPSVTKTVELAQEKMAAKNQSTVRVFEKGDNVLVRDYRGGQKWTYGTVECQSGPLSYKVDVAPGQTWRRHTDQLVKSVPKVGRDSSSVRSMLSAADGENAVGNALPDREVEERCQESETLVVTPGRTPDRASDSQSEKRYPHRLRRAPTKLDL